MFLKRVTNWDDFLKLKSENIEIDIPKRKFNFKVRDLHLTVRRNERENYNNIFEKCKMVKWLIKQWYFGITCFFL